MTIVLLGLLLSAPPEREVLPGLTTRRVVQGVPHALAGNRLYFATWQFVQPGDLDWRDEAGNSVYVAGDSGPFEAHHVPIRAPQGIRIQAEPPTLRGPLDRPHRMILRDGDRYRGWSNDAYFESTDGLNWTKQADLVLDASITDGIWHVLIDPAAPDEERYKSVWVGHLTRAEFDDFRARRPDDWEPRAAFLLGEQDQVACLRGSVSPDGIHWSTLPEPLVVEYCDTFSTAWFDPVRREYVLYTRYWSLGPTAPGRPADIRNSWTGFGRRAVGRSVSADFRRFAPSRLLLEPGPDMPPSEQLYTNCHTTMPGAPDQHLMFPAVWNASVDDTTRIVLAASGDGEVWHWVPGGDLLRTGPFGSWYGGCVWATPELIELPNGDWALPVIGHNLPHKYPRGQLVGQTGWAIWPHGRLVGLVADQTGEFWCQPVVARGTRLRVNALTRRTGHVRIEIVGVDGRTLADCDPLVGDQTWTEVTWRGAPEIGLEVGQPVTLRVELKQGKLYGIEFG